jgi:hypothetical protein
MCNRKNSLPPLHLGCSILIDLAYHAFNKEHMVVT